MRANYIAQYTLIPLLSVLVTLPSLRVGAAEIFIANHSFEEPPLNDGALTINDIPGWTGSGNSYHVINPINAYFSNTSDGSSGPNPIDGKNAAALNTSASIHQDLGIALEANVEYTLTYLVGRRIGSPFGSPSVRLLAGNTLLAESFPQPAENSFAEMSLVYPSPASGGPLGQPLRVEIQGSGANAQAWFDRVRLTVQSLLPEPSIVAQPLSQAVVVGSEVTFTVSALGDPPLSYQWRFNGADLEGENAASLTLADVQLSDSGNYTIMVFNGHGSVTSRPAALEVAETPSIVTSPISQSVSPGEPVTFEVVATGTEPLLYQWLRNGVEIEGATGDFLTIDSAFIQNLGSYAVRVANTVGTALSDAAQLTFSSPPDQIAIANHSFEEPPLNDGALTINDMPGWTGNGNSFHVINPIDTYFSNTSDGSSGPNPIDGMNAAALNTSASIQQDLGAVLEANREYALSFLAGRRIGSPFGAPSVRLLAGTTLLAESFPAPAENRFAETVMAFLSPAAGGAVGETLRVEIRGSGAGAQAWFDQVRLYTRILSAEPFVHAHPASQTVAVGGSVTLNVSVSGEPPFTYQWRFNGADLEGQDTVALTLTDVQVSDAGDYTVTISNEHGSVTSRPATLVVAEPPVIVTAPASQGVVQGDPATFQVVATGAEPLTYQWLHNDVEIAGATGDTLTLASVSVGDLGAYAVRVENEVGTVLSEPALLTFALAGGQIFIVNHSFEEPPLNDGALTINDVPGWTGGGSSHHVINPINAYFSDTSDGSSGPNPIDGKNAAALNNSASIHQELGVALESNVEYTLTYLAGRRIRSPFGTPAVRLLAGGTLLAESFPDPAENTFTETSMVYVSPAEGAVLGQPLRVEIQGSGGDAQAWFDHVRLFGRSFSSEPSIRTQPESQLVILGGSVTLSVSVFGDPPFTYQWRFNGSDLEGQNAAALTVTDAQFSDAGDYTVTVSNEHGSVTSNPAVIEVAEPPAIVNSPVSQSVSSGDAVTFEVVATGTGPLIYQWLRNDIEIAGATGESFGIAMVSIDDLGSYSVRVENAVGTVLSDPAQLDFGRPTNPIFIANHSFEEPPLNDGALTINDVPGWTGGGSTHHVINPINAYFSNTSDGSPAPNPIDGKNAAALNTSASIHQDLGVVLEANTEYVLIYLVGRRIGSPFGSPSVRLLAGGTLLAESFPNPAENTFAESTLVYQSPAGGNPVGQPLRLEIRGSGLNAQAWFDNLRLIALGIPPEPMMTQQPESELAVLGATISLFVEAQGAAPLSYQWQFNGVDLDGQTGPTLTLEDVQFSDAGDYTVVVSNDHGSITSDPAVITVAEPPFIVSSPLSQTASQGDSVTFEAVAGGTEPLNYQWFHDGIEMEGQTESTLTVSDLQISKAGSYEVMVHNAVGSARSDRAQLNLIEGSGGLVIPPEFVSSESLASSGTFLDGYRMQQLYEEQLFPASPILIQQIRWRPDGPIGTAFTTQPFDLELRLSTTTKDAAGLSLIFSENAGPDEVIVYDGSITLSSANVGPEDGPSDFDITVSLSTPFLYDPAAGNLLVDIKVPTGLQASATDAAEGLSGVGRVLALDAGADEASSAESRADVLQLDYILSPIPPAIIQQPQDQLSIFGGAAGFSIRVTGHRPLNYQWLFDGEPMQGQTGPSLELIDLEASSAGEYSVLVSNEFGSATSVAATLALLAPPSIVEQPRDQTVTEGDPVTLSVAAAGDEPLSYQWFRNGVNLPGANEPALVVPQAQTVDAGEYTVSVSNPVATLTSKPATLRILPNVGRALIVELASGSRGQMIQLPVVLRADGNENALGFSLNFNPDLLAFAAVVPGSDAGAASLNVNEVQASEGQLGFAMALPAGDSFATGPRELAVISFIINTPAAPMNAIIDFADTPVSRGIADEFAADLPAAYFGGEVHIEEAEGLEGDVLPLPLGDLLVSITDWVKLGRYAAQLESIPSPGQFQRADCAPRTSLGNGAVTVSDWIQAGRYVAGLDPWTTVGGPMAPMEGLAGNGGELNSVSNDALASKRTVTLTPPPLVSGQTSTISVILDGLGNESALGFSVQFDTASIRVENVMLGKDADGATLNVNTNGLASGHLGVALALPLGRSFSAGAQEILQLTLTPVAEEAGTTTMSFGSSPVLQEVCDSGANVLPTDFQFTALEVVPSLKITRDAGAVILSWPESAEHYRLEATRRLGDLADWKLVEAEAVVSGGEMRVLLPLEETTVYFRLSK